jgi:EAL domain-containing protein (putative c-di-GMP-specific phosphodiesterase class I)
VLERALRQARAWHDAGRDLLKIDRSFVMKVAHDEDDATIVRSTVDLARNLNLRVVAEGVEDENAWRTLESMGCQVAQGFFLSRPVPAAEFDRWLVEWESGARRPTSIDAGIWCVPADTRG